MTPAEKANELYLRYADEFDFDDTYRGYKEQSKQCAIIVVNEILDACDDVYNSDMVHFRETGDGEWWLKVKTELEKI